MRSCWPVRGPWSPNGSPVRLGGSWRVESLESFDWVDRVLVIGAGGNSGLRALQVAQRLIAAGDCEEMIVVGVDLVGDLRSCLARGAQRPWSGGNTARVLDAQAQGPLPGEGAVALLVKSMNSSQARGRTELCSSAICCFGHRRSRCFEPLHGRRSRCDPGCWELGADGSPEGDRALAIATHSRRARRSSLAPW